MRSARTPFALAAVAATLCFAAPRLAHAGLEACNNIEVKASAQCKVETQGGCTAQCTPLKFEAACAAKLETQCDGECNLTASADCTTSCKGTCEGTCQTNPGSLDCSANCKGTCEGNCSGKCSAAANKGECEASCKATCSGSCDAKCEGTPPSATCQAKCEASCSGSCEAKANLDCQINCQSKGYASCKSTLEGGCKTQCTQPKGALFCDGQYVDTGNNLENCIAALNAYLNVKVDASGSAACAGNTCEAEGKASASCASVPSESGHGMTGLWLLSALALVGGVAARRRASR